MKLKFMLLLSLVTFSQFLYAQKETKPTRLMLMEDVVFFNKTMEYEKAQKEINEFLLKNKFDLKWQTFQTNDNVYMYAVQFSEYADLDKLFKAWDEKMKSANQDELNKYVSNFDGTIESTNNIIVQLSESSYTPKQSYLQKSDANFIHWDFFEVIPGMEKQAWALMKDYKTLYEKQSIDVPFHVWSVNFGEHTSTIVISTNAKDDVDFYTQNKLSDDKIMQAAGASELYAKFMSCVKKFNHYNGKPRPDLSIN